jgi:hypothetical protein
MNKGDFANLLLGRDLRTVRKNSIVVRSVSDQRSFDELFGLIFQHQRPLVMRAADAVEKITVVHREYLAPHKQQLLSILRSADHKELKWHIAQLISRIELAPDEFIDVWHILTYWALNTGESKIVRVHALQALFDLSERGVDYRNALLETLRSLRHDIAPSVKVRIERIVNRLEGKIPA